MSLDKVVRMLRAIDLLMRTSSGVGQVTLSDIARWTDIDKSTCWRYMNACEKQKLITRNVEKVGKRVAHVHRLTENGLSLARSQGEMFQ